MDNKGFNLLGETLQQKFPGMGRDCPGPDDESIQSRSPLGTEDTERRFSPQWGREGAARGRQVLGLLQNRL